MQNVIGKVISAEAEARRLVETAQKEADQILADARSRSRELLERTRQESRLEAEKTLALAAGDAEREKTESLARAADEIKNNIHFNGTRLQTAVEAAVRCLSGLR